MKRPRILIVEDERDLQSLLRLFFERQGYTVYDARDGQEAVEVARRKLPDLILMDIQMPRKTGIEAVQELRADPRFANTPILAITAHARNYLPPDIIRAGFDHVIIKPFDFQEIIDRVTEALRYLD